MHNIENYHSTDTLSNVVNNLKTCLENDYGLLYVQVKEDFIDLADDSEGQSNYLSMFHISQGNVSVFEQISSSAQLAEAKTTILSTYEVFIDKYCDFFDRVAGKLEPQTIESLAIIDKTLKNRKKKLESSVKRFRVEDHWNVERMKSEFQGVVIKCLNDILKNILHPISNGLKHHSVYEGVLKQVNQYLAGLGIYTRHLEVGVELTEEDWSFITPVESDDCETSDKSLKNVVKEVHTFPYVLNEDTVILEGEVVLWRVIE